MEQREPRWLLEPDALVDHFKIMRPLDRGGMAEVYLARDQKLGRKVALKLLKRDLVDPAAAERFLFEARATARFSHPHIVTIHFVGEHAGMPYLALEYVEGQTLRERMAAEALSVAEVLRLALAVAQALAEAHSHEIQHRDLKPENIILASDGRPRVVDFGLARVFEGKPSVGTDAADAQAIAVDAQRSRLADPFDGVASGVRGSPAYMAPELWRQETSTGAADVWAFGVMLFELLCSQRPFAATSLADLVARICSDEPSPALQPRAAVPAGMVDALARCLDKDPDGRPSALELVQALQAVQPGGRPTSVDEESPFRGLLPFSEQHADLFFGRDLEIASFVERLRNVPVMPVLGPSGVGKSSFVQAGVIPRLRERGPLVVVQLRPGRTPFVALAARIVAARRQATGSVTDSAFGITPDRIDVAALDGGDEAERLATQLRASPPLLNVVLNRLAERRHSNVLLFVDQLEELATLVVDDEERFAFMQAICTAADDPALPVRAVMTLREEFLSRLARGRGVREAMGQVTVLQSPLEKALTEIVQRPLQARGYAFDDPGLASEMVAAVKDEVACLPLLQFVGQKIWEGRDRSKRLLTRDAYQAAGGVTGALARHADAIVAGMTPAEANLARAMLLRMVTPEGTRRVLNRERLLEGLDPAAGEVLQRLVDGRLVTVRQSESETAAETAAEHELVHESLVKTWDRFARWIEESREELVFLDEVGRAAELWEKRGRRSDEVWTGDALREAWRAVDKCSSDVPSHVLRFLQASRRKELRQVWQRRGALAAIFVALAAAALVFALKERETRAQKVRAEAGEAEALLESASVALAHNDPLEARSRLRSSLEGADSTAGRVLWRQLQASPLALQQKLNDHPTAVAFEPGGHSIVAIDYSGTGYRINLTTARVEKFAAVEGRAPRALTRDGRWLAFGRTNGEVVLRDLQQGSMRVLGAHGAAVTILLFSRDGRWLATGGYDAVVRLWDVVSGQLKHELRGHSELAWPQGFGAGGNTIVTGGRDRRVRVWDTASGRLGYVVDDWKSISSEESTQLVTFSGSTSEPRVTFHVRDLEHGQQTGQWTTAWIDGAQAISHRATEIVFARKNGVLEVFDLATGRQRSSAAYREPILGLALDEGDRTLFSLDQSGTIRAWSFPDLAPRGEIGPDVISEAGLWPSPDQRYLITGNFDSQLAAWDLSMLRPTSVGHGHASKVIGVAASSDGRRLLTGSGDRTARLWDTESGLSTALFKHDAVVYFGVAFSPDDRIVMTSDWGGVIQLWDAATGQIKNTLRGHLSAIMTAAISPDGKLLASLAAGSTRPLIIWDLATAQPRYVKEFHAHELLNVAFSPDSRTLAVGTAGTQPLFIDIASQREIPLHGTSDFDRRLVAFAPDGRTLVTGGVSGQLETWDLATGQVRPLGQHRLLINDVTVSRDGRWVGSTGQDGTARVWDLATGEPVMTVQHSGFDTNSIRFLPDGKRFATTGDDNTVRLWDLETRQPVWRTRALLPRPNAVPEIFTHRGWETLAGTPTRTAPASSLWRSAVEKAQSAASATGDGFVCIQLDDNSLVMLDQRTDRVVTRAPIPGVSKYLALPNACAYLGGNGAGLVDSSGTEVPLCPQASALGRSGSALLVACGDQLRWFDSNGNEQVDRARPIGADVSALASDGQWLLVGHANGDIETHPLGPDLTAVSHSLDQILPGAVTHLAVGPMRTIIAGQLDGSVSLWDLQSGSLLERVALHGPVEQMLLDDKMLYAVSELGDPAVWDLSVLYLSPCELLQQVWSKVPSIWEDGRTVAQVPAAQRGCVPFSAAAPDLVTR